MENLGFISSYTEIEGTFQIMNLADGFSEERTPLKPPQQKRVHWQKTSGSSSRGIIPKAKIKTVKMTFVIVLGIVFM